MFALIIGGPIDPGAAGLALAVMFITLCIFCTSWIVKRRSRREIANNFELAKIKERDCHALALANNERQRDYELGKLASEREIEFKRIDGKALEHSPAVNRGAYNENG